ncbi:hypothetical protein IT568_10925 [bacterium]|nr:hypothetical protein [bacterium]
MFWLILCFLLSFESSFAQKNYFPSPEKWVNKTFFMLMVDRFFDGDSSNNNLENNYDPKNPSKVHGGDFKGVTSAIPYLKALGIDVLWINPIQKQAYGEYHGYAISNFYQTNPTYGTLEDFKTLVKTAHENGIYVCLDVVVNHSGDLLFSKNGEWKWNSNGYELAYKDQKNKHFPEVFQNPQLFHNFGNIENWNDSKQNILGEFPGGLDDFKTENLIVREEMLKIWSWWIEQTDVDAFRIDTAKHVELSFWNDFIGGIKEKAKQLGKNNFWIFAESYDFEEAKNQRFLNPDSLGENVFDSVTNYTLWGTQKEVFGKNANVEKLLQIFSENQKSFGEKDLYQLMTFVDNHDQPRLLNYQKNKNNDLLKLALVYNFTSYGIPIVYYGTETAFHGGNDPENREDFFKAENPFSEERENFKLISELSFLRKNYPAISEGSINFIDVIKQKNGFFYLKKLGEQEIYFVLNAGNDFLWFDLPKGQFYELKDRTETLVDKYRIYVKPYQFWIGIRK